MKSLIKEKPSLCYQCSKCSAGCPLVEEMDLMPHQVMHLLSLGMEERVLKSKTLWMCAGCYTCACRCPNDINITAVMDEMRSKAVAQGIECPVPAAKKFHDAFLTDLGRRGKIHEVRMMGEFNMKIGKPFNNIGLAPKMYFKGRLHILPPKAIKGFKSWMNKLCQK